MLDGVSDGQGWRRQRGSGAGCEGVRGREGVWEGKGTRTAYLAYVLIALLATRKSEEKVRRRDRRKK